MPSQLALFADDPPAPPIPGLRLVLDAITPEQEVQIAARIDASPLTPFQFGQGEGKRILEEVKAELSAAE